MKTKQPRESIRGVNRIVPSDLHSLPPLLLAVFSLLFALPAVAGHKVQVSDPALAQQMANQGGRLLADYQDYQLYDVAEVPPSIPGRHDLEVRDEYNQILLNAAPIDTTSAAAAALRKPRGAFAGKRMHLLQFVGPVKPDWYAALAQTGVRVVNYIPENSYLVYGDAKALAQLQEMARVAPHVQWDGEYLDEYRIHPLARPVDPQGQPRQIGTDLFKIQFVDDAEENAATLQLIDQLKVEPIRARSLALGFLNLVVKLAPASVTAMAAQPDVVSIHPYFEPKLLCERQDQICAGNLVGNVPSGPGYLVWLSSRGFSQAQFDANPFLVDVSDSGIDNGTTAPDHPGLYEQGATNNASRVAYNRLEGTPKVGSTLQGCDGHGTINAHIVGGFNDLTGFPYTDTSGYHYGLGTCPFVGLGSSVIFDPTNFTSPVFELLQNAAYGNGARVSANSWGGGVPGSYDSDSQRYDALVRDAQYATSGNQQMVIVFAAGNSGPSTKSVGTPGTAKNVITVGACENVQPFGGPDNCGLTDSGADSANDIISFSSRGPCADSRKKPDLVAPGTHVSGGAAQVTCFDGGGVCGGLTGDIYFPSGQTLYTASTGTSHSTPAVAGGCALVRQYFINQGSNAPSPAMTKACLMNSARYLTGTGANDTLWSNIQGMGGMNLGMAFDGTPGLRRDQLAADKFTASGQRRIFTGTVSDTSKPFRVTIAWTDAPGSTTGNAWNNNLDLVVTIGGQTYLGNVFSNSTSVTGGLADQRNNVESVFLPAGTSGDFVVTVAGININSDGVPHDADPLDQDFALVIYNAVILGPPAANFSASPTRGAAALAVTFADTSTGFITNRFWDFGDGNTLTNTTVSNPQHTYMIVGTYSPSLTVSGPIGTSTTNRLNYIVVTNAPPVANFVANKTSGLAPLRVRFSNTSSSLVTNASWSFGDGGTLNTNASAVLYTYTNAGTYSVSLTVIGPGGTSSTNKADYILVTNGPPVASFTATPTKGLAPLLVTFTSTSLGMITNAMWSFGDATPTITTNAGVLQHRYNSGGTYSVCLTVAGPYGTTTSCSNNFIVVTNPPPNLALFGDGSFGQSTVPVLASNTLAIAAGTWHNLALRPDGVVVAWGDDSNGQCDIPASLQASQDAVAIAAGGYHSLAIRLNGTVVAWGADNYGQADVPASLAGVIALAAGMWHSVAVRDDGTVAVWGDNSFGQTNQPAGLTDVIAVAAGGNHTLALRANGTVEAWGENTDAGGMVVGQSIVPYGLTNVVAIGAGDYHSLAVKADGTVVAWGDSSQGQCDVPPGLTSAVAAAGGGGHSVALESNGVVVAWGADWSGQCNLPSKLSRAAAVAAGEYNTVVLLATNMLPQRLLNPVRKGNQFSAQVQTLYGRNYTLEFKDSLAATNWTGVSTNAANGALRALTDPTATGTQRFYRLRQW